MKVFPKCRILISSRRDSEGLVLSNTPTEGVCRQHRRCRESISVSGQEQLLRHCPSCLTTTPPVTPPLLHHPLMRKLRGTTKEPRLANWNETTTTTLSRLRTSRLSQLMCDDTHDTRRLRSRRSFVSFRSSYRESHRSDGVDKRREQQSRPLSSCSDGLRHPDMPFCNGRASYTPSAIALLGRSYLMCFKSSVHA